jgi:uncharacterized protein
MVVLGALFLIFVSARGIAGFFTDLLWFQSLNFGSVFTSILKTKLVLGFVFTAIAALAVIANTFFADRLAPRLHDLGPGEQVIMRYREVMATSGRWVRLVFGLLFGLLAGAPTTSRWRDWLMFQNASSFGAKDPLFSKDAGFYVFKLPFISFLLDWMFATAVVCLLVTTAVHYMNGGIRLQVVGKRVASHVKLHLSILLSVLALLKALGYWFDRYRLYGSTRGVVDGPGYTDVHASLPAITLLMYISVLAAFLLLVNVRQRGWRLPIIAVGLWALVAFVAGQVAPAVVQRFQVSPAQSKKEKVSLDRNIAATRIALGLDQVDEKPFPAALPTSAAKASPNVANARLLDPGAAFDAFKNLQAFKTFYRFGDGKSGGLDVDRYKRDGQVQPVVLGARELNPDGLGSWETAHLAYTHGSGIVAAAGNATAADGRPAFIDDLGGNKPVRTGIYVGENLSGYSVVRTGRSEIESVGTTDAVAPPYEGNGGVSLDSRMRRAAFALRFSEWNLFGSSLITNESRIIYRRDVRERVAALAPFLQLDSDPYAAVVDGRITWILDAYTTTNAYPYGQSVNTDDLPSSSGLKGLRFNYIRNSVKATVDAYDGTVKLYIVDPTDPLIQTYEKIFPSLFQPKTAVSSSLNEHFRYPQDLFSIQTQMWGRYRVTDTEKFLQNSNAWNVAQAPDTRQKPAQGTTTIAAAPTLGGGVVPRSDLRRVPPYYSLMQTNRSEKQEFVLVRTFVPYSRDEERGQLTAFMTASGDPGSYGKLRVYIVDEPLPNGPYLISNDASQQFSAELSLLDQAGSQVLFGDLQLIPVGDSLMWIRPWFLLANGSATVPKLQSVTVTVGKRTFKGQTLDEALKNALGAEGTGPAPAPSEGGVTPTPSPGTPNIEDLLADAARLKAEADAALKKSPPMFDEYRLKSDLAYAKLAEATRLATGKTVVASTTTLPTTAPASTSTTGNA